MTSDPGAVDDAAKQGSPSIKIGLGWAKSLSFTTGQCPVMRYHDGLMKMILNEYRLMPWQKEAQQLVAKHMEDFFFGEGAALPPGYVPPQGKQ